MANQERNNQINDRKCDHCNTHSKSLFKCGGCKQLFYCNSKCQRAAWKSGHKQICKYTSELESIHKQISIDYELTIQDRKTKEIKPLKPLKFKKIMLNKVVWWFDLDRDKGLNFTEYQEMINSLPPLIINKIINTQTHDEKWSKWCDLCKKFGFDDYSSAILSQHEVWAVLLEIGTMALNIKPMNTNTGYQHAFHLLITLWCEVRDRSLAPISKQEICDAVGCVTPLSRDIAFIIHAYLSPVDVIFKIGKTKFNVEWQHDAQDIKPLHIMLQKYKEKASKKEENGDNDNDYINWDEDDVDDDDKKNNQCNKLYQYDVSYLRGINDALFADGTIAGVEDSIEINIRMTDEFGVIDKTKKDKKYTFLLGSCLSAKLYNYFNVENHAELISCVLKHYGLDPMNINILYIGKKLFGADVQREMQQKLVKIFNDMNGCNAHWIDERTAGALELFSEEVYNHKIPTQNNNNNNNQRNMFDQMFNGLF